MAQYRILQNGVAAALQLQREIVSACRAGLAEGVRRFAALQTKADWEIRRAEIDRAFRAAFPEILDHRAPIRPTLVSRVKKDDFTIENILFESIPGWQVNASVFIPHGKGPFPAVVCPSGHGSKFQSCHWRSVQTFARNGYIAVTFCPPGCASEIDRLNDHFDNGIIGYLTGIWCQTHFVADALSCIDYLETRADADLSHGVAVTGVSGGGLTTVYCAAYDSRVTFAAPVCCITDQEHIHMTENYTSCPEQLGHLYHRSGIDMGELLSLSAPKPMLLVGGKLDTVFDWRVTERVYARAKQIYTLYGCPDAIDLYLQEDSDHDYTVKMATRVTEAMNRIFCGGRAPLPLSEADMITLTEADMACYPDGVVNIFTINRDAANALAAARPKRTPDELREALRKLLDLENESFLFTDAHAVPEEALPNRWGFWYQPVTITHGSDCVLPGLLSYRAGSVKRPALLYIDESGKWEGYRHGNVLTEITGYNGRHGGEERVVFSVDVSGFGELEMQNTTYDTVYWNDIERLLSYLSVAEGKPLIAYRVRDALIALAYLKTRPEVNPDRIIIAGRGMGAIVATLAGMLAYDGVERVIALEGLAAYHCLTENFPHAWNATMVIPDLLKVCDLPDLAEAMGAKFACINPQDEMRRTLTDAKMLTYYGAAVRRGTVAAVTNEPDIAFRRLCRGE